MKEVRHTEGGVDAPLIVPRIHFASWSSESYILLGRDNYLTKAVDLITSECGCVIFANLLWKGRDLSRATDQKDLMA